MARKSALSVFENYAAKLSMNPEATTIIELELKNAKLKRSESVMQKPNRTLLELGYLPLKKHGMFNLFQLIKHFYEFRSIILTTNKDFTNWNDFFFDENVAVPIIDRLIHHSRIFMLGGESYRLRSKTGGK